MSVKIVQTARPLDTPIPINSNVRVQITNMRLIGRLSGDGKKGREIWAVEVDGLGSYEVKVDIPARTNNLKDPEKRDDRVRALVEKEIGDTLKSDLAVYA